MIMPNRIFHIVVCSTVPLAAFLTFMVQPVVGKHLLPWHGGSASTWVTSMVFFQTALFGGYLLAYLLQRWSLRRQAVVLGILALTAPFLTRLPPIHWESLDGVFSVMLSLVVSLLPALLLTTSFGIVMHAWIRRAGGEVPYYLYSVSNLGSLASLCAYPFLIEPHVGLQLQGWVFHGLLVVLCLGTLALATHLFLRPVSDPIDVESPDPLVSPEEETITTGRKLYWFFLSAAACVAMVGTMRALAGEIGSNPVSWILPLGIYLLSFSITFSGSWRPWMSHLSVAGLTLSLLFYAHTKGFLIQTLDFQIMGVLVLALFFATHLAHGLLYSHRPKEHFAVFYLVIAFGGSVGGFFASISAPMIFAQYYELPAAMLLILALGAIRLIPSGRQYWLPRTIVCLLILFPISAILYLQQSSHLDETQRTRFVRNIYGQFAIRTDMIARTILSENTIHGLQFRDEERENLATTYYHHGTAVGRLLVHLQEEQESLRIGVVGLGVGTLAAYGRPTDHVVFWDIDPNTEILARDIFTFIPNSAATVEIRFADGRLGVRESEQEFDLVVIDAFSGDSIPLHLVTREAVEEILARVPDGLVAFHASNRHMSLFPVLAAHASALGLDGMWVQAVPDRQTQRREGASPSIYFLFSRPGSSSNNTRLRELFAEEYPGYTYRLLEHDSLPESELIHWTDDRHAILDILLRPSDPFRRSR